MTQKDVEALNAATAGDVVTLEDGRLISVESAENHECGRCIFRIKDRIGCASPVRCTQDFRRDGLPVRFVHVVKLVAHQTGVTFDEVARQNGYTQIGPNQVVIDRDDLLYLLDNCGLCGSCDVADERLVAFADEIRAKMGEGIDE